MKRKLVKKMLTSIIAIVLISILSSAQVNGQSSVTVNWDNEIVTSKTTPTLQVVVNPMLKRGSPIHEGSFKALKELGADYVRFVPWFPYPHAAVVELKPPTKTETFWDFSHIDPIMEDLMDATSGHTTMINFSTIPAWMFKGGEDVEVPEDPDQVFWGYNVGTELRDPSGKEVADYFERLFSWYTKGGFTDELGKYHKSGYHYEIPYWEVLNEVDGEHGMTPEFYTKIYDVVVERLKKLSPSTKFFGLSLGGENNPEYFHYFLDPKNHKEGIPLDGITYHFYARPNSNDKSINDWQYSFFEQADNFLVKVKYIESIRKRLSPHTITDLNELGIINERNHTGNNLQDPSYWNLAGAMYAYLYVELAKIGIEVAGESQLVGYPTQFPSVSMMNWTNGKPNARYWVLKLLKENFGPGDKLVETSSHIGEVIAQGFKTKERNKLLLINKSNKRVFYSLPEGLTNSQMEVVSPETGDNPPHIRKAQNKNLILSPFSVVVVIM